MRQNAMRAAPRLFCTHVEEGQRDSNNSTRSWAKKKKAASVNMIYCPGCSHAPVLYEFRGEYPGEVGGFYAAAVFN